VYARGARQGQIAPVRLFKLGKERFEGILI